MLAATLLAQAQQGNAVRVGSDWPVHGPSPILASPWLQGIELAADEINAVGGYLGRPLQLVVKDDRGTADRPGGVAGIGGARVVATIVGSAIPARRKNPPDSFRTKIPAHRALRHRHAAHSQVSAPESYFPHSARDSIQAPFGGDDIVKRGWTRVAILPTPPVARPDSRTWRLHCRRASCRRCTSRASAGRGGSARRTQAARDAGANVIFSYTVGQENAVIANGRKELGWKVPQVGAWPLSFPVLYRGRQDAADGALMAQTFIAEPSNERRAAFERLHAQERQTHGRAHGGGTGLRHHLPADPFPCSASRNGKIDGPSIKTALENIPRVYYGSLPPTRNPSAGTTRMPSPRTCW